MSLMIEGGRRLSGDLTVQGAKNSVLPILAACILQRGRLHFAALSPSGGRGYVH